MNHSGRETDQPRLHHVTRSFRAGMLLCVASLVLAACAGRGVQNNRTDRLARGAVIGSLIGLGVGYQPFTGSDQLLGSFIGASLFAPVGHFTAERFNERNAKAIESAAYQALNEVPTGDTMLFSTPEGDTTAEFTPTRSYMDDFGRLCRDFRTIIEVGEERTEVDDSACRIHSGAWVTNPQAPQ